MRKAIGVCAVCKVDARPSHFHTASHLQNVRKAEVREDRQERMFVLPDPERPRVRSFDA